MPIPLRPLACLLCCLGAVPAMAQGASTQAPGAQAPDAQAPTGQGPSAQAAAPGARKDPTTNPADKAFIDAFRDGLVGMHRSMPTGDTDGDFARLTLPQDNATAEMARAELKYGEDPGLKAIAQQMLDAREKEIGAIQAWQGKHPGQ